MINHVSIGVRDIAATKRFYDAAFAPLGYTCLSESDGGLGYGRDAAVFWINRTQRPVPADAEFRFAFLPGRTDASGRRCLSCGCAQGRRTRQRQTRCAGRLRRQLLRGLCHRSGRLPARGLLRRRLTLPPEIQLWRRLPTRLLLRGRWIARLAAAEDQP